MLSLMEVRAEEDADWTVLTATLLPPLPPADELLPRSKKADVTGAGEMIGENPLTDWDPSESW